MALVAMGNNQRRILSKNMAHRNHRKRQNVKMAAARIEGSVDQRRGAKGGGGRVGVGRSRRRKNEVEEEWMRRRREGGQGRH